MITGRNTRQDRYSDAMMRPLIIGVEHFAVKVRSPLPPLIMAFSRELKWFISHILLRRQSLGSVQASGYS